MEFEPQDKQIVELLTRLKDQDGAYPRKLFASRRRVFMSQLTSVGLGLGVGTTTDESPKANSSFHLPSLSATTILESVLILAIVIQAGIIVYSYRSKIADYVNSLSVPPTLETLQIPVTGSSPTEIVLTDTPSATTTVTASVTPSPSNTATNVSSPTTEDEENGGTTASETSPGVNPQPTNDNTNNDNDNNGNHYGQTPGPPQPKEEPKPTRNKGSG